MEAELVRFALPKGRMQEAVVRLLGDAGIGLTADERGYRPHLSLPGFETKLLKPQNAVEMLHHGSRDLGFAGADWVAELGADLTEMLDTGFDPVRLVAAAPAALLVGGALPHDRQLVVASEYERLSREWIASRAVDAVFLRSYGATEVFPPEDADCIVDNTASGATLRANGLVILDELMRSSTRLYAHPRALDVPHKRRAVEDLVLLLRAVLEARTRVMLEVNVSAAAFAEVIAVLPCMREPTVSKLAGEGGFAVKAAVPRRDLPVLVPLLKSKGATDIIVSRLDQIVP